MEVGGMKKVLLIVAVMGAVAALFGAFFFSACGDTAEQGGDGGRDASNGAFGSICQNGGDCLSLVCWQFGGQKKCTIKCLQNTDCLNGSLGQVCNFDGYCVP
jgi:hypothetical protein